MSAQLVGVVGLLFGAAIISCVVLSRCIRMVQRPRACRSLADAAMVALVAWLLSDLLIGQAPKDSKI